MSKNIVICCDGTGNEFGGDSNSNVVKLYSTLAINGSQVGYYHPGVGTMGAPTARNWLERQWSRLKGLAFGAGLLSNLEDAYRYLMNVYEKGDQIYLFGFSRGAYTIRALGGMLHLYGLLYPGNEGLIPYVTRMFARQTRRAAGFMEKLTVAEQFKAIYSRNCPIHFTGVWDTVSSVGWITDPVILPYTACNPCMVTGRHAISIHERRCYYRQRLWGKPADHQNIKQVWFTGVHSDVGGSYVERESGLSKVTLEWMLVEALSAGLQIDFCRANTVLGRHHPASPFHGREYVPPDPEACMHDSLTKGWWLLEYLPHREYDPVRNRVRWNIPMGSSRKIPEGATIYDGVLSPTSRIARDRLPKDLNREPPARFPPCEHLEKTAVASSPV